jgi:hypothetical protein
MNFLDRLDYTANRGLKEGGNIRSARIYYYKSAVSLMVTEKRTLPVLTGLCESRTSSRYRFDIQTLSIRLAQNFEIEISRSFRKTGSWLRHDFYISSSEVVLDFQVSPRI